MPDFQISFWYLNVSNCTTIACFKLNYWCKTCWQKKLVILPHMFMFMILAFPFCWSLSIAFFRRNFLNGFFCRCVCVLLWLIRTICFPKQNYSFPFFTFFSRYVYHFCQFVFANPTSLMYHQMEEIISRYYVYQPT